MRYFVFVYLFLSMLHSLCTVFSRTNDIYLFLLRVIYQCKEIKLLCYSLYFHVLEFSIKMSHRNKKK